MGPPSQHTAQSAGLVALQRRGVTSRDLINGGSNHGYWRVVKVKVEDSPGHTLSGGDYPVGGDDGSSTAVRAGNLEADLPRPGPQGGQLSCRCPAGVHPASSVWKRRVLLEHSTATGFQRDKTLNVGKRQQHTERKTVWLRGRAFSYPWLWKQLPDWIQETDNLPLLILG